MNARQTYIDINVSSASPKKQSFLPNVYGIMRIMLMLIGMMRDIRITAVWFYRKRGHLL